MATIDLLATIVVIAVPSDSGSEIRNSCLLPSSKSPVESLTIKRDRRSALLADEINYCLLIFRSAKTRINSLSLSFPVVWAGRFAPLPLYSTM